MDNELKDIIKAVQSIKLTDEEKLHMRNALLEHKKSFTSSPVHTRSPYFSFDYIRHHYLITHKEKMLSAFIIILLIGITGGTSAFAEHAVPGDLLYKVKVSVNEPVAGVFAFTQEEKTEWKERLVERRLREVHLLAMRNSLDETKRIALENTIKAQVDDFNTSVNTLAREQDHAEDSSDLNIRLQASLRAYQNVLGDIIDDDTTTQNTKIETGKILLALKDSKNRTKEDNKNIELALGENEHPANIKASKLAPNPDKKQAATLALLHNTKLIYQKEKIHLSLNIQTQIDTKFKNAEGLLQEGQNLANENKGEEAKAKFTEAIRVLNSIKLLTLSNIIKIDLEDDDHMDMEHEDVEEEDTDETTPHAEDSTPKEQSDPLIVPKIDLHIDSDLLKINI